MKYLLTILIFLSMLGSVTWADAYREIDWDELMPADWMPSEPGSFTLKYTEEPAPVVDALNQEKLKLAGYVIPIKFEGNGVKELLLVPYIGACLHVPPPPENQMVYVSLQEPLESDELWTPIWVSGVMTTEAEQTEYATAGYHMKQAKTEAYTY